MKRTFQIILLISSFLLISCDKKNEPEDLKLSGTYWAYESSSLTIVGIPIYVEGKKIMDLNFGYTGNGLGVTMNL